MEAEKEELKRAIISGASHALKYRRERGMINDEDVIQKVTREADEILNKIDREE
jgi:hypothetical protein